MALLSARPCYEGAEGCPICVLWNFCSPQSMHDGRQRKKKEKGGRGKGSGRESLGGEEGGETGKRSIRRTGCASQSETRSGAAAAEPGSQERGASPGLSEDQRGEREHRQSPLYDARKLSSFPPLRAKSTKVRLP